MADDLSYREWAPPASLQSMVRCVWGMWGGSTAAVGSQPIVPDGCPEIVLNLADPFVRHEASGSHTQPVAMVVGQTTGATMIAPSGMCRVVGIRLQPWAGYTILEMPMVELSDVFAPASDVLGPWVTRLHDRLAARVPSEWARITYREIGEALASTQPLEPVVSAAIVREIASSADRVSVRGIARRLGLSERTIQRALRREVGLSPTVLARILRLQRALSQLLASPTVRLGRVAVESGYYDQAHFNREFRRFVGCAPSEFLALDRSFTDHFIE